jgi:hypothetical protein
MPPRAAFFFQTQKIFFKGDFSEKNYFFLCFN